MSIYIEEDKTILEALQLLDKSDRRILFLQDQGILLASITEDAIRRWILEKGDLQAAVKYAANYQPVYLYKEQADRAACVMEECGVEAIPIVDGERRIKEVVFRESSFTKEKTFNKRIPVVIMAGGRGTRLMPYTDILPKPLLPIGDVSMVEHVINSFYTYGCRQFYMLINYKKDIIKTYFNGKKKDYILDLIVEQKELGTGGGLSLLKEKVHETFILTNCDTLIEEDLSKAYRQHMVAGNLITTVCSLKNCIVPYGVINIGENGRIKSLQEKPSMSFFVNTGCYFVEPKVIEELEYNCPVDFTDIVQKYVEQGEPVGVYPICEGSWLDMGQAEELERIEQRLKRGRGEEICLNGGKNIS